MKKLFRKRVVKLSELQQVKFEDKLSKFTLDKQPVNGFLHSNKKAIALLCACMAAFTGFRAREMYWGGVDIDTSFWFFMCLMGCMSFICFGLYVLSDFKK